MTTNLSSVKESIADAEAAGVKVIGTLVQWMIPQRSEISSDLLFDAMKSAGISLATIDELLPKPVTIRKSFTRTIQNFNARRRRPGGAIREFRKIKIDQPGSVCYGLVSVDPDGTARSFSLDNEGWVALIDGELRVSITLQ